MDLCLLQKNRSTDKTGRWRNPGGCWAYLPVSDHNRWPLQGADLSNKRRFGFNYSSEFALPEVVTQECMWLLCESGRFSYGESPRTPPLEGTSLHRRHNRYSVERPWGILRPPLEGSLVFSRPVSDYEWIPPSRGCRWHRHTCIAIFVKQVVFLTVNHRGPLPLRELHSTDDTIVWRDPGGSWACLRPVLNYEWIHPSRGCWWHKHNYMYLPSFWSGSFFLRWITADPSPWGNFTPPTTQ